MKDLMTKKKLFLLTTPVLFILFFLFYKTILGFLAMLFAFFIVILLAVFFIYMAKRSIYHNFFSLKAKEREQLQKDEMQVRKKIKQATQQQREMEKQKRSDRIFNKRNTWE
ncbi:MULTISPECIES: hypothetical protein [unclassified Enterococcus]|uniref:hypothetical protein n=1 Tax=unclassified Enterococcus TaxID=2608891 RepID=UPI001CE198D3|nr:MULTISPECIES: hypothetical protein [unclassified Enterococcus]MCA5014400.1 hypothetical protein [Enterococcus sp. S23]MCA5017487.1 hypothetical protein [Enterococcus sp. S22(2020)]